VRVGAVGETRVCLGYAGRNSGQGIFRERTLQDGDCALTALTRFDVPTKSVFSGPLPSFHLALGNAVVPVHDTTASMPSHIPDAVSAAASRRSAVHSSRSSLAPKSARADSGLRDVARTT